MGLVVLAKCRWRLETDSNKYIQLIPCTLKLKGVGMW